MQTVLALPVLQKVRCNPAAPPISAQPGSPTTTVSATSPSSSTLTFPRFPPPGSSSTSPTAEATQRLTKARVPQESSLAEPYNHNNLQDLSQRDVLAHSDCSAPSGGIGPERHPKSGLAMLLDKNPQLAHPYVRLSEKHKDTKQRRIWNHTLEKKFFTPEEISTFRATTRRPMYIASLEAYIDRVHAKLIDRGEWYPVPYDDLEPFKGLNSRTAKSMVAGLQCDDIMCNHKLLELRHINSYLSKMLMEEPQVDQTTTEPQEGETMPGPLPPTSC